MSDSGAASEKDLDHIPKTSGRNDSWRRLGWADELETVSAGDYLVPVEFMQSLLVESISGNGRCSKQDVQCPSSTSACEHEQRTGQHSSSRLREVDTIERDISKIAGKFHNLRTIEGSSRPTCWAEKASRTSVILTTASSEKCDNAALFNVINFIDDRMRKKNADSLPKWPATARNINHCQITSLTLTDTGFDFAATVHCHFSEQLFFAMKISDLCLVRSLLATGPTVTRSQYQIRTGSQYNEYGLGTEVREEYVCEHASAVEYACMLKKPEVLALLVGHYELRNRSRTHSHHDCNNEYVSKYTSSMKACEEWHVPPLHIVIAWALKSYDYGISYLLPTYVKTMIDAGSNVHSIDINGYTPLQLLMSKIQYMTSMNNSYVDAKNRRILVNVTEILLEAGANPNMQELFLGRRCDPLCLLFSEIMHIGQTVSRRYDRRLPASYLDLMRDVRTSFRLLKEVAKLLIAYGAEVTRFELHKLIPIVAKTILNIPTDLSIADGPAFFCLYNEILDSLGSLLRYSFFVRSKNFDFNKGLLDVEHYLEAFIKIVHHSSQPDSSNNLINMMMYTMSGSNLNKLMRMLLEERNQIQRSAEQHVLSADMTSYSRCIHRAVYVDQAIQFVGDIEIPGSLQFLACRAINRCMSSRTLLSDSDTMASLCLPVEFTECILLK